MHPVVAIVTAGVEMDVLGLTFGEYTDAERQAVVSAFRRTRKGGDDHEAQAWIPRDHYHLVDLGLSSTGSRSAQCREGRIDLRDQCGEELRAHSGPMRDAMHDRGGPERL
jgi:hypothetical protein